MQTARRQWNVWPGVLLIGVAISQLVGVFIHYRNGWAADWLMQVQVVCEVVLGAFGVYCVYRAKTSR